MKMTLKAIRINNNLTQQEASKMLGIAETTLNKYENFKSFPDVPMIEKILKLYKVDYNDIIFLQQNCDLIAKDNDQEKEE